MAINSGHPDCTPWKKYQYKMTRAIKDVDYTENNFKFDHNKYSLKVLSKKYDGIKNKDYLIYICCINFKTYNND